MAEAPQTIFGQTDALALAVVNYLTVQQAAGVYMLAIAPARRFALIDTLADLPKYNEAASVSVVPSGESSERNGMSHAFDSTCIVHLVMKQVVAGAAIGEEAQCAKLAAVRSQILDGLRTRALDLDNAVHPVKRVFIVGLKSAVHNAARGPELYSLDDLMASHVFHSDTILTFRAAV